MSTIEKLLDPQKFARVHRGTIVRIDQCRQIKVISDGLYRPNLRCEQEVAVSERYIEQVRQIFNRA